MGFSCTRNALCSPLMRSVPVLLLSIAFLLAAAPEARAEAQDAEALKLSNSAINLDYLGGKPAQAERKLQKAIKLCESGECSPKVRGQLYRDLGVVYISGLDKGQEGREALARAVQADPSVKLDPDLTTPEVRQAFVEIGGDVAVEETPKPVKKQKKQTAPVQAPPPSAAESPDEPPAGTDGASTGKSFKNWASLSIQQDFFLHKDTPHVCYGSVYACFGPGGVEYTDPVYQEQGNRTDGGLALANTRILLGFERLLLRNVTVGGRLGIALNSGPSAKNQGKPLFLHLEVRGAYYFLGDAPFEKLGFRPFGALALGLAEVDSRIRIEYFADEQAYRAADKGTLDAWRRAGHGFIAPTVGAMYALAPNSAIIAEVRMLILFGISGLAPALSVGYARGF